jgi:hypothetical protein
VFENAFANFHKVYTSTFRAKDRLHCLVATQKHTKMRWAQHAHWWKELYPQQANLPPRPNLMDLLQLDIGTLSKKLEHDERANDSMDSFQGWQAAQRCNWAC